MVKMFATTTTKRMLGEITAEQAKQKILDELEHIGCKPTNIEWFIGNCKTSTFKLVKCEFNLAKEGE